MTLKTWDINEWNGEQDSPYVGPKGCFQESSAVDIRKVIGSVRLASAVKEVSWSIPNDSNIVYMCNLDDFGAGYTGVMYFTKDGRAYLNGVQKFTISIGSGDQAWEQIIGMGYQRVSGVDYFYYFTKTDLGAFTDFNGIGKIHRSTTDFVTIDTSYREFRAQYGNLNEYKVIHDNDRILFGAKGCIIQINDGEIVSRPLEIDRNDSVTGFTRFQNYFRIYTQRNDKIGFQYIWDGTSSTLDDVVDGWRDMPPQGVTNDGAFDYAITGTNAISSDLYLISGTQKQALRVNADGNTQGRGFTGQITNRSGIIYMSGGIGNVDGLFTFGSYYPGVQQSLVLEYPTSQDNPILFHTHVGSFTYFCCNVGATFKIFFVEHNFNPATAGFAQTGYIKTKKYVGDVIWSKKSIDYMEVGYSLSTGQSIEIYASANGGTMKLLRTLTYANDGATMGVRIDATEFSSIDLGQFNEIELKFVLKAGGLTGGIYTTTPLLHRVTLFYSDNLEK